MKIFGVKERTRPIKEKNRDRNKQNKKNTICIKKLEQHIERVNTGGRGYHVLITQDGIRYKKNQVEDGQEIFKPMRILNCFIRS